MQRLTKKVSKADTFGVIGKQLCNPKIAALFALALLSSCQGGLDSVLNVAEKPLPGHLKHKIEAKGMSESSPILLRIFKVENVMEVWKEKKNGRYALLETYEICKWSGELGPKFKEGDRQAPEGFYDVGRAQMNPNSKYHLSFNIGFPNKYDRSNGRTGTHLMVHGACSSAGCYSMTDDLVEEIYALAREAFKGGQKKFQVQAYPFRLTPKNMAKNISHPQFEFWKMLKEGYDHFELTKYPVKVDVCDKRYAFNRVAKEGETFSTHDACPQVTMPNSLLLAYSQRRDAEMEIFSKALNLQKINAKLKGELLNFTPSQMTLAARGSEILPAPTPKPVIAPAVAAAPKEAVIASGQAVPNAQELPQNQVLTGAQNNALYEAQSTAAASHNTQVPVAAQNTVATNVAQHSVVQQSVAQQSAVQNGPEIIVMQPLPSGSNIPLPLPANRSQ